jgi:hypothetical protein
VTPIATPTPTPEATNVQGEDVPTAGEGENAPESGDVKGENDEGTPEAQDTTPVATAAPTEASAGELPFTGVNAWWIGLLGLTVAGTGVVLRRRSTL